MRLAVVALGLAAAAPARAQTAPDAPGSTTTMFPHPADSRWWVSGQVNLISQAHGPFPSPYQGDHSLQPVRERAHSGVWTIYTGVKLPRQTEFLFDIESAGGRGLSDAFGLAGFTNLDVVRNPTLGAAPYVARVMVHTTIPLSGEMVDATPTALALAPRVSVRRIEIRAGKLGMADFFDLNAVGGDSHLQFTNWTVDNNGAYDYAADTRGYTYAAIAEYDTRRWSVRFAEALMPKVANGIELDWNLSHAHAENLELEIRPTAGLAVRVVGYANHANMGSYDEAIRAFLEGQDPRPDVAYTEVNNTALAGGDITGGLWHRDEDRVGVAMASNGLSEAHRQYLALGGLGFLLGDGRLSYGRENIVETYYTAHLWRGASASAGLQYIDHPGYNEDRGPVLVSMLRLHVDF